jgi:rhamnopyranosyl-N-acetylglucosaminyl-diphospho-decaprenol beta-1,3/1,4-galactofuranosyltransferase
MGSTVEAPPSPRQDDVTAVVVTHNRLALLERCLSAVRQQSLPPRDIVVVDNGSTDSTPVWLSQQQDLRVVRQANLGPAAGFARGLREAAQIPSTYLWLLDDDCLPADDCLERLLASPALMDGRTVVGSVPVSSEDPDKLAFPMPLVSTHRKIRGWYGRLTTSVADITREADSVGYPFGSFYLSVLLPQAVVDDVGVPRAELFVWGDEVEYFYRIRSAGYQTYIILDSIVQHPPYRDTKAPLWKESYRVRNTLVIHRDYFRWSRLRAAKMLLSLLIGRRGDLMRPYWDGITGNLSRSYLPDAERQTRPS